MRLSPAQQRYLDRLAATGDAYCLSKRTVSALIDLGVVRARPCGVCGCCRGILVGDCLTPRYVVTAFGRGYVTPKE